MLRIFEWELEYMVRFPLSQNHRIGSFSWTNTERLSPYTKSPLNETPLFCSIRKTFPLHCVQNETLLFLIQYRKAFPLHWVTAEWDPPFFWSNTERHSLYTESPQNETALFLIHYRKAFLLLRVTAEWDSSLADPIRKGDLLTLSHRRMRLPFGWDNTAKAFSLHWVTAE